MQDVEDEPLFAERVAGIDIAKTGIEVAVRVPGDTAAGRRQQETRSFRTTRKELLALADWLRSWGVTKVGMESTGDYWKPVCFLLEQQDLDCVLYHAAQVKALPGRPKTDKQDAVRIAKITERGSLPSSFVPPEDIRRLRTRTRYRRTVTQARTAEMQRAEKLLEDAHLKLSSVISGIHGVSGRAMLEAIIAGERNPVRLAQLARGRMRGKIRQLEEALDCSFLTGEHVFILTMMLAAIDGHTARISELTARIEQLTEPYWHQIGQLNKRMPKRKALVATGNSILTIYHALLSDPAASYHDLGPGYYDQRAGIRRQARNHLKSLERLGCKVTLEPLTPDTEPALPVTG